jgi:rfaE bifunctional protein nucleotidyltransferase chain/domain/rfaE bifunctional protein kinase chain/domain
MSERIVVVGDTLLDRDIDGVVERIAPDAPAPVLAERSTTERPGGAGLAALLAARAGHDVALVTALADDEGGARLTELLGAEGVQVYGLPLPGATPEKIRLRARGQVLLRLDRGGDPLPPGPAPDAALAVVRGAKTILVSDYGRGVTRHTALREALAEAAAPIVWDPHPRGAPPVPGARLVTPNQREVSTLTDDHGSGSALSAATRAGDVLRRRWRAGAVAVTMGAAGAVLCQGSTPLVVPTRGPVDGDTCGAGDAFAVHATLALAGGALVSEAVEAAVQAATAFVATGLRAPAEQAAPRVGPRLAGEVVADVRDRGGTVVATGGCFDVLHAGHVATLEAARRLGDCLIVCLNSDASVRGLKGPDRPVTHQDDRSRVLASLACVDAVVVFDEPTPTAVLSWLRPDVWVKGGDYRTDELPETPLLARWGGRSVVVPYLPGRSTTNLLKGVPA